MKMSEGLAKDNGQQEPKNGEGTTVTQEVPAPGESTLGGLNKRPREDENNSEEVEENLSYNELKEKIVTLKKRAEFAEALVVERDNELEENLNEIVSVSEELIEMKKKLKVATEEITNLQNENRNLKKMGDDDGGDDEVSCHSTDSSHPPSNKLEAAAIRRAKIKSIREARNNIDADGVAQKKEGADTDPPKTSTPNHNHKVVLNISCDSNKKPAEQMDTSGSGQASENSGVWSDQKRIKKVNKPCNRDPCPFGPARCKFLHFTEEQKRVAMEARDQEPVGAQSPQKRNYSNRGRGGAGLGRGRGQTNASSGSAALTRKDWVKIEVMKGAFSSL